MKKILIALFMCLMMIGCGGDVKEIKTTSTAEAVVKMKSEAAAIASFGDDKVIYIDENKIATIISKSGDVLSKTDLKYNKPIKTSYFWKTSIPHNKKDTLYAEAAFVDDVIYYNYHIENGKTYGVQPYFVIDYTIKVLDLPCSSGWVGDIKNKKYFSCNGKVKASLAIWKEIINEFGFSTTSRFY